MHGGVTTRERPELGPGSFKLAAFLRTTLPLALDRAAAADADDGRYHSVWMPDHMVSFWPDTIWTPEFTDLAEVSPSPHRYLDALPVAGAVAATTERVAIATSVLDTARRHPALIAQSALTLDHLSSGRFILGIGSGERENVIPYGIDFDYAVSRFEEALQVIDLLWAADGPVDFAGRWFHLERARLDTEPFDGRVPPVWIGASGPRMLGLAGRYADGWWPTGSDDVDEYAAKLAVLRRAADEAGRDPDAIVPAKMIVCLIGERDEVREMLSRPLVKSLALQLTAESFRRRGFDHPMGDAWRGIQDLDPSALDRARLLEFLDAVDPDAILATVPHGPPDAIAAHVADLHAAGLRVASILDYSGMAGQDFAAASPAKVRAAEDAAVRRIRGAT